MLTHATTHSRDRCASLWKSAAQTALLVFSDTKANTKKTKRAVFRQRVNEIEENRNRIN